MRVRVRLCDRSSNAAATARSSWDVDVVLDVLRRDHGPIDWNLVVAGLDFPGADFSRSDVGCSFLSIAANALSGLSVGVALLVLLSCRCSVCTCLNPSLSPRRRSTSLSGQSRQAPASPSPRSFCLGAGTTPLPRCKRCDTPPAQHLMLSLLLLLARCSRPSKARCALGAPPTKYDSAFVGLLCIPSFF